MANWVDQQGGLPPLIKQTAKHIAEKNPDWDQSRCIATAVAAIQKMAASGDTNFPGKQAIGPKARSQAEQALAQWERMKTAAGRTKNLSRRRGRSLNLAATWTEAKHPRMPNGQFGSGGGWQSRISGGARAGSARPSPTGPEGPSPTLPPAAEAAPQAPRVSTPAPGGLSGDANFRNVFDESQEDLLVERLGDARYAEFTDARFNPEMNPGTHMYENYHDEDSELGDGETADIDWPGLAQYYAADNDGGWFGYNSCRDIRVAASDIVGTEISSADPHAASDDVTDDIRIAAFALLQGVHGGAPVDQPLYRGTFAPGVTPEEMMQSLREGQSLDLPLISTANDPAIANAFATVQHSDDPPDGTTVIFEIPPGARGVPGRRFPDGFVVGANVETDLPDEFDHGGDMSLPREYVTGGRFEIGSVVQDGSTIRVVMTQSSTFDPYQGGGLGG